ncbi:MAG: MMPL family transporter [Thermoguttaceae bacterium]|nr:MMPL family transporter [Thermoguttaceae bacterium]MDW8039127.1 MMPL family transporter [Thermoguttaceae bacterium]
MAAERMPQEETSLLAKPMAALTAVAVRYPVRSLAAAALLALVCMGVSARYLRLHTARSDLINPQSQYHRCWLEYTEEFTDQEDVVVVVEGQSAEEVAAVAEQLVATLEKHPQYFTSLLYRMDFSKLRRKGLYYLPVEQLEKIEQGLQEAEARLASFRKIFMEISRQPSAAAQPAIRSRFSERTFPQSVGSVLPPPVAAGEVGRSFFAAIQSGLAHQGNGARLITGKERDFSFSLLEGGWHPKDLSSLVPCWPSDRLQSADGRMAFILLRLVKEKQEQFARHSEQIEALRRIVAHLRYRHPEVNIGLTGLPIIEHDEMRASEISSARASLLALIGVMFVFVMGFGGLRHPLLANAALLCGMIWATGFTTLAVGRLNILSIAFGAILIGQGADFGIYYIARYLQLRKMDHLGPAEALIQTGWTAGPSIADGALGTAAAFFMAGLTDFQGVAELGIIAGGGLILCWLATMVVLPAMVRIVDGCNLFRRLPEPLDLLPWFRPLYVWPRFTLAVVLVITAGLGVGLSRLWYDHNLFNLLPAGLESVQWERRLVAQTDKAVYYALSIADSPQQVQERKRQFLQLSSVDRVEEIASVLADQEEKKQPLITRIHQRLQELASQLAWVQQTMAASVPPVAQPDLLTAQPSGSTTWLLDTASDGAPDGKPSELMPSALSCPTDAPPACAQRPGTKGSEPLPSAVGQADPLGCYESPLAAAGQLLASFSPEQMAAFRALVQSLAELSDPEPPRLQDLPQGLCDRFVGRHGRHLMKVYSKADIWDLDGMTEFVRELRSVDPQATGNPVQIYEASRQLKQSFIQAALYASLVIVPLLWFDFRNCRHTFWAILPLLLGMVQMFGLLGLLNIPLNPANMIVLPIILGIGIDNGVHIVHDFLQQGRTYRQMSPSTCMAIVINSLCNMVGFGSLMIASHQGLQSLGRVLTIGMACILANSLVLPNLLVLYQQRQNRQKDSQQQVPTLAVIPDVSEEPASVAAKQLPRAA